MRFRSLAAAPLAAAVVSVAPAAAQDVLSVTRHASPAVVTLHAFNDNGREMSLGSGFFLPDGRIATNRHVVEGASRIRIADANDRTLGDATFAEAVGRTADLAILPRVANPPATVPVASSLPEAGETVVVIGAPEGLSNTVSSGIVSAIRQVSGRTLVQISAPISHGSSGGPVLNLRGQVIGVSVSILSEGQNLNFAVPSTELQALMRSSPGHLAFTSNLRGGGGGDAGPSGAAGVDYERLDRRGLPRIGAGQTVTARLTQGDFRRDDGSLARVYVYSGRAGEQITATLRSRQFDAWLEVDDPNSPMIETDDDSGGNLDAQVTATLPHDGEYLIVANSVAPDATGAFTLSLQSGGVSSAGGRQPGGTGSLQDLARRSLPSLASGQTIRGQLGRGSFLLDDNSWVDGYFYNARAGETVTFTMRSPDFDSWLVVDDPNGPLHERDDDSGGGNDAQLTVTFPHAGRYLVAANQVTRAAGSYTLTAQSGGGGGYNPPSGGQQTGGRGDIEELGRRNLPNVGAGQTVRGQLGSGSFLLGDGTYADGYEYQGRAGERITVTMRSSDVDAFLFVYDPNGSMRESNDDGAGGNDAQITVTLPHDGRYVIVANQVFRAAGSYTLSVQRGGAGGSAGGGAGGYVTTPQTATGGSGTISEMIRMRLPGISAGQTVSGALTRNSYVRSDDHTYANGYVYNGRAGERITVTMRSSELDSWVVVDDPNGPMHEFDDDSGGGNDAQLTVTLPHDGQYLIVANTVSPGVTGSYTLSVRRAEDGGGANLIRKIP